MNACEQVLLCRTINSACNCSIHKDGGSWVCELYCSPPPGGDWCFLSCRPSLWTLTGWSNTKKTLLSCIMGDVGCRSLTLWICLITNSCSAHWRLKRLESVSSCTGLPGRASGGLLLEALATLCSLVMIQYFPADCTKFAGKTSALSDGCQASTRLLAPMVKLWGPDGAELPTSGNNDTTDRWCEVPLTSTWILP